MAKGKQGGKTAQQTTRPGKRLGVKMFGGQQAKEGSILVRQRGTKIHAGLNVGVGSDHTLFAMKAGLIKFSTRRGKQYVNVE